MKSFFGNAIVKKTLSFILILAVAAVAFATPLKPQGGFGDAKVYDSSYKAIRNPQEVSDNFVIKTSSSAVILTGGTISVEVEANSLLQFVSLGDKAVFYLLDGRAIFSTKSDFEVRTPVTSYKAQAGTAIYVITEDVDETAFVNVGKAKATNLITGEVTEISEGQYIDNAQEGFKPASTTRKDFWAAKAPAEEKPVSEPVVETVQPEVQAGQEVTEQAVVEQAAAENQPAQQTFVEEPVAETVVLEAGALEHTFLYRGIRAVLRAYIGVAELEYPEFVTDDEIDAAARAAVITFPETITSEITYDIVKPGLAEIYYPETYGQTEFELAIYLLDQELPGYIDAILGPVAVPEQQVAVAEEPAQPEKPAEQPAEAPQPVVRETIESKIEKPAEPAQEPAPVEEEPAEESKGFRFGATIGFIYGHGDRGDYFADPLFLHERVGVFLNNYLVIVDPIISVGDFKFGLHLEADLRSGKIANPLNKFSQGGITGIVNGVMQFVSLFSYTKGNFSVNVDRTSNLEFRSPIVTRFDRNYDHDSKLLATMNYSNSSGFGFAAFVDDLQLNAKLDGRSQFAGARMSYLLGKMEIGMSVIADFGSGLKNAVYYPGGDATLPFTIKDVDFSLEGGAVAAFPADKTAGKAAMVEGKFNKTSGMITFSIGAAYSVRYNFNDIVNNGPTDVISVPRGKSIDVLAGIGVNLEHFRFSADVRAPFALKSGSRLVYNTVKTKYGNTATISADTMNLQADVFFGKFTFTAGAAFNGFAGRVADLLKAFRDADDRRAALAGIVDPEISTIFAKAEFAPTIGPIDLSIYVRADLMTVKSKIAIPLSAGAKISF